MVTSLPILYEPHSLELTDNGPRLLFLVSSITGGVTLSRNRRQHLPTQSASVTFQMAPAVNTHHSTSPIYDKQGLGDQFVQPMSPSSTVYRNPTCNQFELGCNNPQTPELPVQPIVYEVGSSPSVHGAGA